MVLGQGNVAVDVARMLLSPVESLQVHVLREEDDGEKFMFTSPNIRIMNLCVVLKT